MTKIIALVAAAMFAGASAFAGSHGECMKQASNEHMACQVSFASLDLTPAQKAKLEAVKAEHVKEGCTEASEAKYMKQAKSILNKDQYAKFKAECSGHNEKEATKT